MQGGSGGELLQVDVFGRHRRCRRVMAMKDQPTLAFYTLVKAETDLSALNVLNGGHIDAFC
jgi:hypothetical protein